MLGCLSHKHWAADLREVLIQLVWRRDGLFVRAYIAASRSALRNGCSPNFLARGCLLHANLFAAHDERVIRRFDRDVQPVVALRQRSRVEYE